MFRFFVLFVLFLGSTFVRADHVRRCRLTASNNAGRIEPDMPETFWAKDGVLKKVKDGLALTIERDLSAISAEGLSLFKGKARCRLVYDLWAEQFSVSDVYPEKTFSQRFPEAEEQKALHHCLSLDISGLGLRATDFKKWQHVAVLVQVNPIDAEQEKATRAWLAGKGLGGQGSGVVGRALGAVINLKTDTVVNYDCTP